MCKCKVLEKLKRVEKRQKRILAALNAVFQQVENIMATQGELTAQVQAIGDKLTKIGSETSTLLTKIEELKVLAQNATPELQAAVEAVAQQAQVVDDLVPDQPTA